MKTDSRLKKDVEAELEWDPELNASAIGVSVQDGVVTLTGHIDTYADKDAAQRALRRVAGVKAIAVELDVRLAPEHERTDTEIATAIKTTLEWNTLVGDKVQASVEKGWVTLRGDVEWDYQRRGAEVAVRTLAGVKGINNLIHLKPRVSPSNVKAKIADSFKRQVDREMDRMNISVEGSTVRLSGTVHSWHERDAAQGIAWSTPGVTTVINELVIG